MAAFQYHDAVCVAAGLEIPVLKCSAYGSIPLSWCCVCVCVCVCVFCSRPGLSNCKMLCMWQHSSVMMLCVCVVAGLAIPALKFPAYGRILVSWCVCSSWPGHSSCTAKSFCSTVSNLYAYYKGLCNCRKLFNDTAICYDYTASVIDEWMSIEHCWNALIGDL